MSILTAKEGDQYQFQRAHYTVQEKCTDTSASGHWVCTTHSETFVHNMAMHSHTSSGSGMHQDHVMVWMCHAHGPEVP